MASHTTCVRHGLYLPATLLARIKEIARKGKKSINKQFEDIIREWFELKKAQNPAELTREEFHRLPLWRKRQILEDQARSAIDQYAPDSDWANLPLDEEHEF